MCPGGKHVSILPEEKKNPVYKAAHVAVDPMI